MQRLYLGSTAVTRLLWTSDVQGSPNKQLQLTVQTVTWRGARASFHCARPLRCRGQRAAAELRR